MKTEHFEFIQFDFDNLEHIKLEEDIINAEYADLISRDIDAFIRKNLNLNKENPITNVFVVKNDAGLIGLAFVNFHGEEIIDGKHYDDEIEIGCGLHPDFMNKHLGSIVEYELADLELKLNPEFDSIVARIDDDNIRSIKAVAKAGFVHTTEDYYVFKR